MSNQYPVEDRPWNNGLIPHRGYVFRLVHSLFSRCGITQAFYASTGHFIAYRKSMTSCCVVLSVTMCQPTADDPICSLGDTSHKRIATNGRLRECQYIELSCINSQPLDCNHSAVTSVEQRNESDCSFMFFSKVKVFRSQRVGPNQRYHAVFADPFIELRAGRPVG